MTPKIKTPFYFLFLLLVHSAYSQTLLNDSLNGIWKMRGYGKIIEINDTLINNYDATSISRTINSQLKREDILQLGKVKTVNQNLLVINQGVTNYFLDRINELPKEAADNTNKLKDPNYNFDVFWNMMNENYPFFKERKMDWLAIKTKYQDKGIKSEAQLQHVLKNTIGQLNDGHTTLYVPRKNSATPHYGTNNKTSNLEDKILKHYIKEPKRYGRSIKGNGLLNYGITENNVGYIQINNMLFFSDKYKNPDALSGYDYLFDYLNTSANNPNHFEDEKRGINLLMEKIIEELQGTNAIILDLRFNSGGYDFVSLEILKYFITKETKLYSKKAKVENGFTEPQYFSIQPADKIYTKPVFFLTSHQTASAPEALALGSMAVTTITRVGSNTEGIFSDILEKKLPNGWTLNLSNEVYQNIEGICYEGIGVPPNKEIDYPLNENSFIRTLKRKIKNGDEAIEMVFKLIQK